MSGAKLVLTYSARMVTRQWRRFVLPFLSLAITATILTLVLLVTQASTLFLNEQSRSLLGGDVVIESAKPFDTNTFWNKVGLVPERTSNQVSFTGTLQQGAQSAPFSIKAVDATFPLYGAVTLQNGTFTGVRRNEIYIDAAGAQKLGATVGTSITFGTATYTVAGIISAEPTSLFAGFRIFPQAIMSQGGFAASGIDPVLLRAEYAYAAAFSSLSPSAVAAISAAKASFAQPIDVDVAGKDQGGVQVGLGFVSTFLIIAVLITAVLTAVNVYASTLYFVSAEKKNLAVLLALGLRKRTLVSILGMALLGIVLLSSTLGVLLGNGLFVSLASYISSLYSIILPTPSGILYSAICIGLIGTIAIASFIPAITKTLTLNPKQILIGADDEPGKSSSLLSITIVSVCTLVPLMVFASFLIRNILYGVLAIISVGVVYTVVAFLFSLLLSNVYKKRATYSFFVRSIVSQKKADGFFGIISFTSLFIALVSICSLALLQLSLEKYLANDLSRTIPSTYVLDVQPSQKEALTTAFPTLTLFENIRARITDIDGLRIQDELAKPGTTVDRELGREFNVTARTALLANEVITAGVWHEGKQGEISVDEAFSKQANITLGSTVSFTIQGFPVTGTVTSLRKTDSRSGLPFFYFVLSPQDVSSFPAVYFGYAFTDAATQNTLTQYVAKEMPNVSVLDTQSIGAQVASLVQTLLTLVFIITLPPLLIATLLIATLVVSSYESRRREGARLRALGATRSYVRNYYLVETVSLTLFSAVVAYVLGVAITVFLNTYYLKLPTTVFFDPELLIGLSIIVGAICLIGLYLFKKETMPLRELLSYETNV